VALTTDMLPVKAAVRTRHRGNDKDSIDFAPRKDRYVAVWIVVAARVRIQSGSPVRPGGK
jgi:hypothetical protein